MRGHAARSGRGWARAAPPRAPRRRTSWTCRSRRARGRRAPPPRTNTTKPSARPTPAPPWASDSIVTSTSSPRRGRAAWLWTARASRPMLAGRALDLAAYRAEAEEFLSSIDREYYLHYSGQQDEFEIEPIYERHAALFSRESVDSLREAGAPAALIEFAVQGLIGQETKEGSAELARREAALELEWDGETVPFRSAAGAAGQRARPRPPRRAGGPRATTLMASELNPLTRELLERSHELARELGWASMRDLCQDLSGTDLGALARADRALPGATREDAYEDARRARAARRSSGWASTALRRSDLTAFFRAPALDAGFPERAPGAVAHRDAGRDGHRRGGPARRDDRHRAPAEEVAARVLRAGARAGRGVPGDRPGRRARGLRRALPRGRATPSTTRTWTPRCRWRTATWATTR